MTPREQRFVKLAARSLYKNLDTEPEVRLSDEELLDYALDGYENMTEDPQHQGAQSGSLSEVMVRAFMRATLNVWRYRNANRDDPDEKKRDGCLELIVLGVLVVLLWENKRVGTELLLPRRGPLAGRRLARAYTKRKGSSGQKKGVNTYSIAKKGAPDVISAHVITLNVIWFFAARDIARPDGTLYEVCLIDVDTGELFVTSDTGAFERCDVTHQAMSFRSADIACERAYTLQKIASLTSEEISSLPESIALETSDDVSPTTSTA